jgi:hypothetical protein
LFFRSAKARLHGIYTKWRKIRNNTAFQSSIRNDGRVRAAGTWKGRRDCPSGCGRLARRANFRFTPTPNQRLTAGVLFRQEGRSRVVTNAGRDVVDAKASARHGCRRASEPRERWAGAQDERRLSVRQNRVVLTPRRWRQVSWSDLRSDGDKQARSPGRARHKP